MKAHAAFLVTPTRSWHDRPDQPRMLCPRYRKVICGQIRRHLGPILHALAILKECQIVEGHLNPHPHSRPRQLQPTARAGVPGSTPQSGGTPQPNARGTLSRTTLDVVHFIAACEQHTTGSTRDAIERARLPGVGFSSRIHASMARFWSIPWLPLELRVQFGPTQSASGFAFRHDRANF